VRDWDQRNIDNHGSGPLVTGVSHHTRIVEALRKATSSIKAPRRTRLPTLPMTAVQQMQRSSLVDLTTFDDNQNVHKERTLFYTMPSDTLNQSHENYSDQSHQEVLNNVTRRAPEQITHISTTMDSGCIDRSLLVRTSTSSLSSNPNHMDKPHEWSNVR